MSTLTEPEKKILEAAKKVFETEGFMGARMQQIADETGISKASLHYYFRSKEKLFEHIFEDTMSEFLALVSTWEDDSEPWDEKLRKFVRQFFTFLSTKSLLFLIRESHRNPELLLNWKRSMKSRKNRFIAYFEKLKADQKIRDLDIHVIFIFLHSLCAYPILNKAMFKISTKLDEPDFDKLYADYPDHVANFLIDILRTPSQHT
ncbi:MAG TPA: TetR/AcrR family transcriptional regulator [Saprospiraceae bacterium]|nr:TetR/AcrR family transcriptional regulator [Saprospiraceae bacterium]